MLAKTVKLLPGERMGWRSSQSERCEDFDPLGHWCEREQNHNEVGTTTTTGPYPGAWLTTRVYEFEFWVMDHSAGSEVVLGTDFMIPTGICLDLFNATAKLPGEEMMPLVKSLSDDEDSAEAGMHLTGGPMKSLQIPAGEWIEFRLQKRKLSLGTMSEKGQPTLVRLTNITDRAVYCPAHLNVIAWVPRGFMPKQAGYTPTDSRKYEKWKMLAYAGSHDETWFKLECELYERWLASQPPLHIAKLDEYSSDDDDSLSQDEQWSMEPVARSVDRATDGSPVGDDPVSAAVALGASPHTPTESSDVNQEYNNPPTETQGEETSPDAAVADLEHTFMCVMHVLSTEGNDDPADDDYDVHEANYISLEDYAQELAFLPDLTEPSITELDYTAPNVKNSSFIGDQQRRLDEVLRKHEAIMISSGNALSPPAYGVVCDIDVEGHTPIKQRVRRIPLRHLQKLYELLKGLLKAGLIAFSDNPWALPIAINDQDIRLCIDYKMVNAVTAIMEYAMPLVDDLLTELENYLWFCWLDASSVSWMPQVDFGQSW
ncbi:hypothetical protein PHMEG_00030271 [Phytophthora megakarya]|uniref:Reverse transcriptase n=1 Tax=Phytophthora megakarya TaxID=4795 RepID=A0A225V094_9STRA|nr:hypothetical protein PHMEG_00030271 [Phytophthora megakarya]